MKAKKRHELYKIYLKNEWYEIFKFNDFLEYYKHTKKDLVDILRKAKQ